MPVRQEFCENGHVITYYVISPWQIDDLIRFFPDDMAYRTAASHKVHTIVNVQGMRQIPSGAIRTRHAPALIHPNSGQFVVVGITPRAHQVLRIILRLAQFEHARMFQNDEDARSFLREIISAETDL
jgi:hypothetical protein